MFWTKGVLSMLHWIVLGIVVVLVCLVLSAKIGVRVVFGPSLRVWVKIGPVMMQVYPMQEKEKKKPEKKRQKESEEKTHHKEKRNITFDAVWQLIHDLIEPLLDAMDRVRKSLRVRCLSLHLVISDPNPAVAAQRYGKLNAVLWPLTAAVENTVTVERRDIHMNLDFAVHRSSAEGELFVTMRLYHGVHILLADGMKLLRPVLHFIKTTKPAKHIEKNTEVKKDTNGTAAA